MDKMNSENLPIDETAVEVEDGHRVGYSLVIDLSPDEAQLLDQAAEGRSPTVVMKLALKQYALGQRFRRNRRLQPRAGHPAKGVRQFSSRAIPDLVPSRSHGMSIARSAFNASWADAKPSEEELEAVQQRLESVLLESKAET